jgi:hypothetical protein
MRSVLGITLVVALFVPAMISIAAQNQPLAFEVASGATNNRNTR